MNFAPIRALFPFYLLICLFFPAPLSGFSQNLNYAHKIIDTLASPAMHGRGYVNDGDKLAAGFIAREFELAKLLKFPQKETVNMYFQPFTISVNTFPSGWGIGPGANNNNFTAGSIAQINPASPSIALTRSKVIWLDSSVLCSQKKTKTFLKSRFADKVLIIDNKGVADPEKLKFLNQAEGNTFGAKCLVVFKNKKLTWDIAQQVSSYPSFDLLVPDSTNAKMHELINAAGKMHFYVENKFLKDYKTQNVVAWVKGTQYPDSFIVFSAHYDHLGQMGKDIYMPGANDNASGCAMLLSLAQFYSKHPPSCSIAFMAFSAEEVGLIGSKYYVEHPLFPLKQIKFLINLDLLGTGDEGITVVNGTIYKTQFDELVKLNEQKKYLTLIKQRGKAANSDHYYFTEKGVKSFFIYTLGGIKAYHDIYDRPETLPLTKFENVFRLLIDFTGRLQGS